MNYVERHFGDWARDTAHLTMLEDGAYNRLVDLYYVREQPLPRELAACCRLVRAISKPERDAVRSVLAEFFHETPDGWAHKRCDAEIERFRNKSGKARASANVRWSADRSQSDGNANASADAMRTHNEGNATRGRGRARSHSPNTNHQSSQAELAVGGASSSRPTRKPPADFAVTDAMREWALNKVPLAPVDAETERFRDHTFATAISDWAGAWRNWLRKAHDAAALRSSRGGNWSAAQSFSERTTAAKSARLAEMTGGLLGTPTPAAPGGDVIDMEPPHGTPRLVG